MLSAIATYARRHHLALIALFVALGGTSYAAIKLPKHSVGTAQLKKNAVTSLKVKNGSLRAKDFKKGQLPAGPQGPPGPVGPRGADATNPQLPASEPWHEVTSFDTCTVNPAVVPWHNYGGSWATVGYYRDPLGIVHLKGSIACTGSAYDYSIFTLPPGYRPAAYREFLAATDFGSSTGLTGVSVGPTGTVSNSVIDTSATSGATHRLSLDGIDFRCEPSGSDGCP